MGPQIIASNWDALIEITKPQKLGLRYAAIEAGVSSGVLNGIKGQIIQRKTAIGRIEV